MQLSAGAEMKDYGDYTATNLLKVLGVEPNRNHVIINILDGMRDEQLVRSDRNQYANVVQLNFNFFSNYDLGTSSNLFLFIFILMYIYIYIYGAAL